MKKTLEKTFENVVTTMESRATSDVQKHSSTAESEHWRNAGPGAV